MFAEPFSFQPADANRWYNAAILPTVVNLQRKIRLELAEFKAFAAELVGREPEFGSIDFAGAFISDRRMKELNKFFRGKLGTTDVLSFPYEPDEFFEHGDPGQSGEIDASRRFAGDIVISVERAAEQAVDNGLTLEAEIRQLILHGLLHLCGYAHETADGEMNARELELRERFGI